MNNLAPIIAPALRVYRGSVTDPSRWETWQPRKGDLLVCTPPKCGTTWTQTILAMLVNGGADLPGKVPVLSPWVDADLGVPAGDVAATLAAQEGRRVVKTHTPADGFPIWDGVTMIAVYRHPLDVFFSVRKHVANTRVPEAGHPMSLPVHESFDHYVNAPAVLDHFDRDSLASLTLHYAQTALSGRLPQLRLFHYADMLRDGRRTVERLAEAAGIEAGAALIDEVARATEFGAMKSRAADYAPVAGTGYWKSEEGFFDSASSEKWKGKLSPREVEAFETRLAELLPDEGARRWLKAGDG